MPADPTPIDTPVEGDAAAAAEVHARPSLRAIIVIAVVLLLSLWLVGEAWAGTIGSVGGCGGG